MKLVNLKSIHSTTSGASKAQKGDFMKSRTLTLFTAMTLFAALAIPVQTSAQITAFNAPGAGTAANQGTNPVSYTHLTLPTILRV